MFPLEKKIQKYKMKRTESSNSERKKHKRQDQSQRYDPTFDKEKSLRRLFESIANRILISFTVIHLILLIANNHLYLLLMLITEMNILTSIISFILLYFILAMFIFLICPHCT